MRDFSSRPQRKTLRHEGKDEELWLHALQERNNVAHSYNHEIALSIVRMTKGQFYQMFCDLRTEIEGNWL